MRSYPDLRMKRNNRGFLFILIVGLIPVIAIWIFAYSAMVREEAWRVHRTYWNELMAKGAESIAEETISWLAINSNHCFYQDLLSAQPGQEVSVDLLPLLQFPAQVPILNVLTCTLTAVQTKPFFDGPEIVSQLPSGFKASSDGYEFPDPREKFGLLKLEIIVEIKKVKRKFEVLHEFKITRSQPGFWGQFSLFVREKKPGKTGDLNQLALLADGFVDPAKPLGNPLMVINHPDDDTRSPKPIPSTNNPLIWDEPKPVPGRKGWVFLGSNLDSGSYRNWYFQPAEGTIEQGARCPDKVFLGGTQYLPFLQTMAWDTNNPRLQRFKIPAKPITSYPSTLSPTMRGWVIYLLRCGAVSTGSDFIPGLDLSRVFGNHFLQPEHLGESFDGSLIYPMGDVFPINGSTFKDRRSPTVVLGPVGLRFLQVGGICQINDSMAAVNGDATKMVQAHFKDPPGNRPKDLFIPYFPLVFGAGEPALDVNRQIDPKYFLNPLWGRIDDGPAKPGITWAPVSWFGILDVLGNNEFNNLDRSMSKVIQGHLMSSFDFMIRGLAESTLQRQEWFPPALVQNMPPEINAVDDRGNETTPRKFMELFMNGGTPAEGAKGSNLMLKDSTGAPLFVGNLAALSPFGGPSGGSAMDWRQKATKVVDSPEQFSSFLKDREGKTFLDLRGQIVLVKCASSTKELVLESPRGAFFYSDGGMIIVDGGGLRIKSPIRRDPRTQTAPSPLVLATAGDFPIFLGPGDYDSYLFSSNTIKRLGVGKIKIFGGLAVRFFSFDPTENDNFFKGVPGRNEDRTSIVWDPVYQVFDPGKRQTDLRLHIGEKMTFWKSEPL